MRIGLTLLREFIDWELTLLTVSASENQCVLRKIVSVSENQNSKRVGKSMCVEENKCAFEES